MNRPEAAVIEIVEKHKGPESGLVVPNEIRINGTPLLVARDPGITIHAIELGAEHPELVQVTLTLFAKRVVIGEEAEDMEEPELASETEGATE